MGFFDTEEKIESYVKMAEGFDGKELINRLKVYLERGKTVLEIGMGPGVDLDILKECYTAVGSDTSDLFLQRYLKSHPDAVLMHLDALTLDTDRLFDAVYSNKVFQCLDYEQCRASFQRQAEILNPGGIILHSFWYGKDKEEFDEDFYYQMDEEKLRELLPPELEILEMKRYKEMEEGDSLYALLRLQ